LVIRSLSSIVFPTHSRKNLARALAADWMFVTWKVTSVPVTPYADRRGADRAPTLYLTGGLVSDGREPPRLADLAIDAGRITTVIPASQSVQDRAAQIPPSAVRYDLRGHLITPGLIDVHTHLLSEGAAGPLDYERELIHDSLPLRTLRAVAHARLALDHGFTIVRDLCTEGAGFADVALRTAIESGLCEGPRVFPAGPGIGSTGGYLPSNLAPGVCVPSGCAICDGPEEIRREVRRQISFGASWIKVFADWDYDKPIGGQRVTAPTFSPEELTVLVEEAGRRERRVAAHALSDTGARQAIECKVASIEHLGQLSSKTLDLAAANRVFLVPTLSGVEYRAVHGASRTGQDVPEDLAKRQLEQMAGTFRRALDAGVAIACGSDIGAYPHQSGALSELRLMMDFGMTPLEALRAATGVAASLLGLDDVGLIASSAAADLCAFPITGPGHDLGVVLTAGKPSWVIQAGTIVRMPDSGASQPESTA
jgi:imidazolonepropionase-like amidohydrolase